MSLLDRLEEAWLHHDPHALRPLFWGKGIFTYAEIKGEVILSPITIEALVAEFPTWCDGVTAYNLEGRRIGVAGKIAWATANLRMVQKGRPFTLTAVFNFIQERGWWYIAAWADTPAQAVEL